MSHRLVECIWASLLMLGFLVPLPLPAGAATSEEQIREVLPQVLDETYQTELPAPSSDADADEDHGGHRIVIGGPFIILIARIFFFVCVGAALGLLLYYVSDRYLLPRIHASDIRPASAVDQTTLHGGRAALLRNAEALAAEGHFGEAIHALLHGALAEVDNRLASPLADSWTSREIMRLADLPMIVRHALGELVTRVEITHFGGIACDESDYLSCRESFERVAHGCAQEGA